MLSSFYIAIFFFPRAKLDADSFILTVKSSSLHHSNMSFYQYSRYYYLRWLNLLDLFVETNWVLKFSFFFSHSQLSFIFNWKFFSVNFKKKYILKLYETWIWRQMKELSYSKNTKIQKKVFAKNLNRNRKLILIIGIIF